MKTKLALAALAVFAFANVSSAQDMKKCDDETIAMVMKEVEGTKDAAMKEKAMMEFDMAKTAMEAKDSEKCSMHLDMATKAAMGQ